MRRLPAPLFVTLRFSVLVAGNGLRNVEYEAIKQTLAACNGNITHAAELLGIHRPSLQRKLRKMGL